MPSRSVLRRAQGLRHRARGRSAGSTTPGEWIPNFLVDYLNTPAPDPYDFRFLLKTWADEEDVPGIDEDTMVDDLDELSRERFARWLASNDGESHIFAAMNSSMPEDVPAYIVMNRAARLPKGSWLIHYTDKSPFTSFDRGATLETPLWMTGSRNPSAPLAKCPDNLSDDNGPYEVVFGFAFPVGIDRLVPLSSDLRSFTKYGRNAVLFRSDLAIQCYHLADEETQAVFPICSEYDAIPIYNANRYGGGTVMTDDGEQTFDTVDEILRALASDTRTPHGRTSGATRGRRRWHPKVKLPRSKG